MANWWLDPNEPTYPLNIFDCGMDDFMCNTGPEYVRFSSLFFDMVLSMAQGVWNVNAAQWV
eukprot:1424363-Amphidinium_carterae.1